MVEIDRLSEICARAISDANITNCYPHEARPVVEAILSAVGICVGPDAPQEPCACRIGDCTRLTRQCREVAPPQSYGPGRCEVCGWPLADSQERGCVPDDCSYRPEDPAEQRRIAARRAALANSEI